MRTILIAATVAVGGTLIARRLGYNLGTDTVVRCRQGHLFTTIWIPGIKFKELDGCSTARSATTGAWSSRSATWISQTRKSSSPASTTTSASPDADSPPCSP